MPTGVFSPDEVLRTRLGPARWWRLGLSPLYPDLLLESGRELLCGVVNPVMATHADKLNGRVLVADDHPVNRALLERQLGILGVECVVVENGEQALQAWQAELPHAGDGWLYPDQHPAGQWRSGPHHRGDGRYLGGGVGSHGRRWHERHADQALLCWKRCARRWCSGCQPAQP